MRRRWTERCLRLAIAVGLGTGAGIFAAVTTHTAAATSLGKSSTTFASAPTNRSQVEFSAPAAPAAPAAAAAPAPATAPVAAAPAPAAAPAAPAALAPAVARAAASAPAAAPATLTIQQRGEAALGRLSYPYQQLGYTIAFLPGTPGYFGRGFHEQHRIEVYVRNSQSDADLAHVVAHEIGHAVDWVYHNDSRDQQWLRLRGLDPATSWAPCPFCPDFGAPSGDFAEVFALWQLGNTDFRGTIARAPSQAEMQQLSRLFYP